MKLSKAYKYNTHANLHELGGKKFAWSEINQRLWHLLSASAWHVVLHKCLFIK